MDRAGHRNRGLAALVGCGLIAVLGVASGAPSRAGLPEAVRDGLAVCLDERRDFAARRDALEAAGWRPLAPEEWPAAALAHAPAEVASRLGPDGFAAFGPDELAEDLASGVDFLMTWLQAEAPADGWFALPEDAGHGRITDFVGNGSGASCTLSADLPVAGLVRAFGPPVNTVERGGLVMSVFAAPGAAGSRGDRLVHLQFEPGTFPAFDPLPIVAIPRIPHLPASEP